MSQVYRIFVRHESESQPTWFKVRSSRTAEELFSEIEEAMSQPAPAVWKIADIEGNVWLFRADKIYTVCVYPPEAIAEIEESAGK